MNYVGSVLIFVTEQNTVDRGYDELEGLYAAERADESRGVAILGQFLESLPHAVETLDSGCGPGVSILRELSSNATVFGLD